MKTNFSYNIFIKVQISYQIISIPYFINKIFDIQMSHVVGYVSYDSGTLVLL